MVEALLQEAAQQVGCLTVGDARGQGNGLAHDPGAGMLAGLEAQSCVQWTGVGPSSISHLPTAQSDPAEARQEMERALLAAA